MQNFSLALSADPQLSTPAVLSRVPHGEQLFGQSAQHGDGDGGPRVRTQRPHAQVERWRKRRTGAHLLVEQSLVLYCNIESQPSDRFCIPFD